MPKKENTPRLESYIPDSLAVKESFESAFDEEFYQKVAETTIQR